MPLPARARLSSIATQLLQIAGLGLICASADAATRAVGLPVPGAVVGFFALFALLASGRLPARALRGGSEALISHLTLFFVPPMLALSEHSELLSLMGLKIVAAVVVGTLVVMGGTALAVELYLRREARRVAA